MSLYGLFLNPMCGRAEESTLLAVSTDAGTLACWVREQEGPWDDVNSIHTWRKMYRRGSPLEWFNPPMSLEPDSYDPFNQGIRRISTREEHLTRAGEWYDRMMSGVTQI